MPDLGSIHRYGRNKAVFLDRDGVLNRAIVRDRRPYPPRTPSEFVLIAGVDEACRALKVAGFQLIIVTNQPDISRGTTPSEVVDAINDKLRQALPIDEIAVCPHDDRDGCSCRKPKPGLLVEAARRRGVDLRYSVMVGDRWRDVAAGRAAGCRTVFIDYDYDEPKPDDADLVSFSLLASLPYIISMSDPGHLY